MAQRLKELNHSAKEQKKGRITKKQTDKTDEDRERVRQTGREKHSGKRERKKGKKMFKFA